MQQAIPYGGSGTWGPQSSPDRSSSASCSGAVEMRRMVGESPVVVVGRRGCCMCHVVKRLLLGLGVNPAVCEVGEDVDEGALIEEYYSAAAPDKTPPPLLFPAVFIGGRLVGGLDRLMAVHISGDLVPILKDAGALWL